MNSTISPGLGFSTTAADVLSTPVQRRAALHLNVQHGQGALTEAVRQGMLAKQRGDDAATTFWCTVCSLLVQMRQATEIPVA